MKGENLLQAPLGALPEERFEELLRRGEYRLERIVSRGHRSPEGFWYVRAAGAAHLQVERNGTVERIELRPGDHLDLPPHTRHRVAWTDPHHDTIWLALFYPEEPPHETR